MFRLGLTTFALFFLVWAPAGFAQGKKNKADPTRSVQGTVSTAGDVGVKGAVVQLKNVKTLQIRSFITQENGPDVFVHYSAIASTGFRALNEGDEVEFEVVQGAKGPQAQSVKKISTTAG